MNLPTPPIVCSKSCFGSFADTIDAFVRHLRPLGLSEPRFFKDLREARHFLIWLASTCGLLPLESLKSCPGITRQRSPKGRLGTPRLAACDFEGCTLVIEMLSDSSFAACLCKAGGLQLSITVCFTFYW